MIIGVREGRVEIAPGFDGVYGQPLFEGQKRIIEPEVSEIKPDGKQKSLSEF
jgi:hypothetical protein